MTRVSHVFLNLSRHRVICHISDDLVCVCVPQVSLLQVFLPGFLPEDPVRLQAAVPGAAVHEHHPAAQTVALQRVRGLSACASAESETVTSLELLHVFTTFEVWVEWRETG